jgi:hypothetical protein
MLHAIPPSSGLAPILATPIARCKGRLSNLPQDEPRPGVGGGSGGRRRGAGDSGSGERRTVTFTGQLTPFDSSDEWGVVGGGSGTLDAARTGSW